ncbi:FecR family protein [Pseudobacteriovorax antillogorgiicola]|uniref:FecR family protein n=2 Tax=Pseudobacteriovorax antillogorgiicola TaxID=1513793 RepID=A0A1Y6C807_9BACT|nr:FecR family protein [Pseudobacteriovorax antillogorgiicola]SMF49771.1 FecR family protein [Pseudobacteriovorax antillogorgiicola]
MMSLRSVGLCFILVAGVGLAKGRNEATLTKFYGKVRLFKNPSQNKDGPGPFAKVGGTYFTVVKAAKGATLKPFERIQTGSRSKAKLVYSNGDQITVSANTAYEVSLEGESGVKKPVYDMIFGKIRGLIRGDGPRHGMKVRSNTMVMGVRGTDFFVAARGKSGHTEVSVLRGQVEVTPRQPNAKPVKVDSGFTISVPKVQPKPKGQANDPLSDLKVSTVKVEPTTKAAVAEIYQETIITAKQSQEEQEIVPPKVKAQLEQLERKAVEATRDDIKKHDPVLFEKIRNIPVQKIESADDLQAITTKKAFDAAPKAKASKARFKDLENSDIYDKYFSD